MNGWTQALVYGALSGFSLLTGGVLTQLVTPGRRTVALTMAFGAGFLIASLSYGLVEEAYRHGGLDASAIGLLGGAVLYYLAHAALLHHGPGRGTHYAPRAGRTGTGFAIVTAAVMDGLPEQFVLGVGVKLGSQLGLLVMAAILLSNLSEAVVATPELVKERGRAGAFRLWALIGALSTAATLLGFLVAEGVPGDLLGFLLSFAAGAVLAMLADTLLPEAYRQGGRLTSLATAAGFLLAFILTRWQ
ncbi:MAG TPA: ZIP family zinc transporter [Firmicutes bacterium]|nr:ZIP family zinc transporter [Bacillota bacterium]